jgi:hypothetical protein
MKILSLALFACAAIGCIISAHADDNYAKDNTFGQLRVSPQGYLPPIEPVMDIPMRDPHAMLGPDGFYYLVGTQPPDDDPTHNFWNPFNGIRVFRSPDLKHWDNLGYVYTLRDNASWQLTYNATPLLPQFIKDREHPKPTIWAPDMYYIKGTWWIAYCLAYNGWAVCNGMLKSTSGKVTGPYVDVNTDGPITDHGEDDPGLFQADDGRVFFVWCDDKLALMNNTMNKLAEKLTRVAPSNMERVSGEGGAIREINGRFYAQAAGDSGYKNSYHGETTYDMFVASSDNIYGPYGPAYIGIRNGGHNVMFRGKNDQWYATFFGWNAMNPFNEKPGVLSVELDEYARIAPYYDHFQILSPDARVHESPWSYTVSKPADDWASATFDDHGWQSASGAFGGLLDAKTVLPVRASWTSPDIWLRKPFTLPKSAGPAPQVALDVLHSGPTEIYINGVLAYKSTNHLGYYTDSHTLSPEATAALLAGGTNILALHSASGGEHYVDAGLRLFTHKELVPISLNRPIATSSNTAKTRGEWVPKRSDHAPWIAVDLGKSYELTRTDIAFTTPKIWHHYKIEYSVDNSHWNIFYHNTRAVNGDPCYTDIFDNGISADHVTGRYVRLTLEDSQDPAQSVAVSSFRVYGHSPIADSDLALGKAVTASGAEPQYPAKNLVDGYWGSIWRPNGNEPKWATIDLGSAQAVGSIVTSFASEGAAYRYQIDTSNDNQTWTSFADRSANTNPSDPYYTDNGSVKARYVRLTVLGVSDDSPIDVRDIKVYGVSR